MRPWNVLPWLLVLDLSSPPAQLSSGAPWGAAIAVRLQ